MRITITILAILLAAPCVAQDRIFRASSLDIEQNDRLSAIEARLAALERKPTAIEVRPAPAVSVRATPAVVVQSAPAVAVRSASYNARWHNYDGRTARQHAVETHGFDPSLSDAQLAAQHDAYHDQYGGDPPTANRSRSVQMSYSKKQCPYGGCPPQRSTWVQSKGGLLGFGFFGK